MGLNRKVTQMKDLSLNNSHSNSIQIKKLLRTFNKYQLKVFYGIFVHCWANDKGFISKMNFFELWRRLNDFCYGMNDDFPNPYEERQELKEYCVEHPYYFIGILSPYIIANLFSEFCDEHLDVLVNLLQIIREQDTYAAFQYVIDQLEIEDDNAEESTKALEKHIEESI